MQIDNTEDYETLHANEQYLYNLCKEIFHGLNTPTKWDAFVALIGSPIATKLAHAVAEGPDPRMA